MKRIKRKKIFDVDYEKKVVPIRLIDADTSFEDWDKKELKTRSTYFLLNGVPEFSVNQQENGRMKLLAADKDFYAAGGMGVTELTVRVYRFSEKNAEVFSCVEKLKNGRLGAMEEAYLMERLIKEFSMTQDDVGSLIGKSRPAVANTLRLLTLVPEVIGLVESGRLSAGHARTLVKVPQKQQLAFAEEGLKRGYSVREMERAVKAFLTPPEILQQEAEAKAAARGEELKALVERMRGVFRTKVSLIGNAKKGRIYIDYYSAEDLYRIEEFLDVLEKNFD
ncbi:MAG: ParB/RepB/Spo0J family partition protein [Clostridiales bacterium]|nr:ParB/RepB/Spo0J family partition protein [Clostridiales bacterium]